MAKPIYDRGTAKRRLGERYHDDNLIAARIYAADPERYPGIMQEWAAAILRGGQESERALGMAS